MPRDAHARESRQSIAAPHQMMARICARKTTLARRDASPAQLCEKMTAMFFARYASPPRVPSRIMASVGDASTIPRRPFFFETAKTAAKEARFARQCVKQKMRHGARSRVAPRAAAVAQ